MSWLVVTERTADTLQPIIDQAPKVARCGAIAFQYCTESGPFEGPRSDDLCCAGLSLRVAPGG